MSSGPLSSVPRFAVHPVRSMTGPLPQFADSGAPARTQTAEEKALDTPEDCPHAQPADTDPGGNETLPDTHEPVPEPEVVPTFEQSTINSLHESLAEVGKDAERFWRERSCDLLQELVAELFPRLAREFLAQEIVGELLRVWPVPPPRINIALPGDMLDSFRTALDSAGALDDWTVKARGADEANLITVSWEDGGAEFDFDRFLEECATKLENFRKTRRTG